MQNFTAKTIFAEKRLLALDGLGAKLKGLINPAPLARNDAAVNPEQDISDFVKNEKVSSGSAMQHPLRNIITGAREGIKKVGRGLIAVPNAVIEIPKTVVTAITDATSKLVANVVDFGAAVVTRPPASAIAFISNTTKHALDLIIRFPASLVNVMGAYTGRGVLKVSEYAQKGQEKITHWVESGTDKMRGIGNQVRSKIDKIKIPEFGFLQPSAA